MEGEPKETAAEQPPSPPTEERGGPPIIKPPRWNRRRMITLIGSAVAGLVALSLPKFLSNEPTPANADGRRSPRFRARKNPALYSAVLSLGEGFYARPPYKVASPRRGTSAVEKTVIHYVDSAKRLPFVSAINEGKLRPAMPDELALKSPTARVRPDRAAAIFELAALERINQQDYVRACELLIDGIQHDLTFKNTSSGAPSLRLFDLLAALVVRRGDCRNYQDALEGVAEATRKLIARQHVGAPARRKRRKGLTSATPVPAGGAPSLKRRQDDFEARVGKWKDTNSKWRKRISDPAQQIFWSVTAAPDTTQNKNAIRKFEIKTK